MSDQLVNNEELVKRLRAEEDRMQRLWDACEAARVKHKGTSAAFDFNGLKHAVAGRDPVLLEAAAALSAQAVQPDDEHVCPVCAVQFKVGDTCATDIELGMCHAACLEDSPVVDLDTGEPTDGPISTYPYEPDSGVAVASCKAHSGGSVITSSAGHEAEESPRIAQAVQPVAWRRDWNFKGNRCLSDFTDDPELAEIWRGHPQTDVVTPLYATPPASAGPAAVKALEWRVTDYGDIIADSVVGRYRLGKVSANTNYRLDLPYPAGSLEKPAPDYYWPEHEAKAAAQADFERRIRSTLAQQAPETDQ